MAIKTTTFGRVELSGEDSSRFRAQMNEASLNKYALAALKRAREVNKKVESGEAFSFSVTHGS